MKSVKGWWFVNGDCLPHGDNRKIKLNKTHTVKGEIIPCENGLHLSKKIIDALDYAKGSIIYRVLGHGTVITHGDPVDKYACSKRTYLLGGINVEDTLRKFSRMCALDVIHLWNAPDIVVEYLKTGEPDIRAAARDAAWAAARDAAWDAAWAAARDTARAAARDAAWAAAWNTARAAARDAAWAAAWNTARDAAWAAARAAAWAAARAAQNRRLHRMVLRKLQLS